MLLFLEMYELTDQFVQVKESSGPKNEGPALPSRNSRSEPPPAPVYSDAAEEEEFEKMDEPEDYQLPDATVPKPGIIRFEV